MHRKEMPKLWYLKGIIKKRELKKSARPQNRHKSDQIFRLIP